MLAELDGPAGLRHRWHQGRAGVEGQLDDHAFLIWGLLDRAEFLEQARTLLAALAGRLALDSGGHSWSLAACQLFEDPERRLALRRGGLPAAHRESP